LCGRKVGHKKTTTTNLKVHDKCVLVKCFCSHESSHLVLPTKFQPEITHNQFKNILRGSLCKWFLLLTLNSQTTKKNHSSWWNISLLTKCKPANVPILFVGPNGSRFVFTINKLWVKTIHYIFETNRIKTLKKSYLDDCNEIQQHNIEGKSLV